MSIDNTDRAEYAECALEAFCRKCGLELDKERLDAIGDLLTNLMHYCDANDINFHSRLMTAYNHYQAEMQGE